MADQELTFEKIFDASPNPAIVLDNQGIIRFANRVAIDLLQTPTDDLVGKAFGALPYGTTLPSDLDKIIWAAQVGERHLKFRAVCLISQAKQKIGVLVSISNDTVEYTTLDILSMLLVDMLTPLKTISGYVNLLLEETQHGTLGEQQRQFVSTTAKYAEQLIACHQCMVEVIDKADVRTSNVHQV